MDSEDARPLCRVLEIDNLWKFTCLFRSDLGTDRLKYKYVIYSKGHDFKLPLFGRIGLFSQDPSYCEERGERSVKSEVQFDVFHFPGNRLYYDDTLPQSVVFYLQLLFSSVHPTTVSEFISQIERLNFTSLKSKHVTCSVNWIVKEALERSISDVQCLYLCIVLGRIEEKFLYGLTFPKGDRTAEACDRLLQGFSAVDCNILSTLNFQIVKKVAVLLVENCSSPGWLTLAAHFYPVFGVKFVLGKKYSSSLKHRYDVSEYQKMVRALLLHVKETENRDDQLAHQRLLLLVLESAPVLSVALKLSERSDVCRFFANDDEMVSLFVKFCQEWQRDSSINDTGAKMVDFFQIPNKFRCKMHKLLYPILLEYAKSDDKLKDEHVEIFLQSIISDDVLADFQIFALLMELSKSKSVSRQNLLLEILNNKLFEQFWHEAALAKKVDICKTWVMTRVNYILGSSANGVDKTKAVYEAIDAIMRCSLNIRNQSLVQDVSKYIVEKILGNEDGISVLQAFTSIEKCVSVVQECYKSHAKKILEHAPKVVRKSKKFLKDCSSSRYAYHFKNTCSVLKVLLDIYGYVSEIIFLVYSWTLSFLMHCDHM